MIYDWFQILVLLRYFYIKSAHYFQYPEALRSHA